MEVRKLIQAAVDHVGSEDKLGELTGYSQNGIWQAKNKGRVTPEMALAIHRATQGLVSACELRPDIWPTLAHVPGAVSEPIGTPDAVPEATQ